MPHKPDRFTSINVKKKGMWNVEIIYKQKKGAKQILNEKSFKME